MHRRRRRRKNTRRASNKDSEIFAGQLFSCPVFSREDEIVAGDRAQRENVPRHIRSSPHCLPGLTSSSRKCPVPVCQCFLSRIFTAIEKQPPSCTLHARKKATVLLFRSTSGNPVAKSTTFRYGVPFAHAARFLSRDPYDPLKCLRKERSFRPHEA